MNRRATLFAALAMAGAVLAAETRQVKLRYATPAEVIPVVAPHHPDVKVATGTQAGVVTLSGESSAVSRADATIRNFDLPARACQVDVALSAGAGAGAVPIYRASVSATDVATAEFDLASGRTKPAEGLKLVALKGRVVLRGLQNGVGEGELKMAAEIETAGGKARMRFAAPLYVLAGQVTEVGTVQVTPGRTLRIEVTGRANP